jgi:DtxR family Mn-dependent transcriptional regulator
VLEAYLATVLGYPWDRVHEEAERLEHAVSDELVDRMARALGDPAVDPHGAPIPTREGRVDETVHGSLADLAVGDRARVVRVTDEDGAMLRYLDDLGIHPGTCVILVGREPFDGPLTVLVGDTRRALGSTLARQLLVEREG